MFSWFLIAVAFCLNFNLNVFCISPSLHCQTNPLGRTSVYEDNIISVSLILFLSCCRRTLRPLKSFQRPFAVFFYPVAFFAFLLVVHTPRNDKNPHLPFLSLSAAHCGTVTAGKLRIKVGLKSESPDMKTDLNYAFTDNDPRGNMQQRLSYSTYFVCIIRLHCSHSL